MTVFETGRGIVFWPVGNGDSTTLLVRPKVLMQIDLNHLQKAKESDDSRVPMIDKLIEQLPIADGAPYLSAFALTHPDQDHCRGFKELLKRVRIGELWFTPRVFLEYKSELCDDAKSFRDEAVRRAKAVSAGSLKSEDRLRVIGYHDVIREEYPGFPDDLISAPGTAVTVLNGYDESRHFRAFVHAPFKDDAAGERNESCLGLQVTLIEGEKEVRALLLGDLSYTVLKRIFDISGQGDVAWDLLLAPHHCSKSAMYWRDDDQEEETLRRDILASLQEAATDRGNIVSSSENVPSRDEPGANPPHAKAKARYEEITPNGFYCTADSAPHAITLALDGTLEAASAKGRQDTESVRRSVAAARGSGEPPKERVGFGR